ncbi:hypothetical protein ACLQ24_19050 [Micromonospora sp. DT4]|uniref:hypothetical protein n=1 Tax=Micromonospora sp. DT4 TaxID=3393438 RepID=UPI003CEB8C90
MFRAARPDDFAQIIRLYRQLNPDDPMTGSRNPATHAFHRACGFSADVKTAYLARPSKLES